MVKIIAQEVEEVTLEIKVNLAGSLLEMENEIQKSLNETGCLVTEQALRRFDTDDGIVSLQRHLYQTSKGGKTYCPLDTQARIIQGATPRFALSHKYSNMNAPSVCKDLEEHYSILKHDAKAVENIIEQITPLNNKKTVTKKLRENLKAAQSHFTNNKNRMNYAYYIENKLPIGSGVTEAACKTLVKQRLSCSGMRWSLAGAKVVLSLRALVQSKGRWQQFWNKINQFGVQIY